MSEDSGTLEYQRSINTGGGMRIVQQAYILPWPAMEAFADDATNLDYQQYPHPEELFLLLDKAQAHPETRNIVQTPDDGLANSKMVEISQSSESSPVIAVVSPSDQSHSRSTSSASPSLHTNQTTNSSDSGNRLGFKKATLSTFFSSTTNLIGCVKQAMKSPLTVEKYDFLARSKKLGVSW
jgi:hypothetical protein